jgi:ParB family chromosome partitioning protein
MAKFSIKDLLNDQSKPTSSGTGSGFVIRDVPIDKIVSSPSNKYGIRDIEELAASIEEMGLLHNLVVREPDSEGNYELISGERRFHACKLLYENGNTAFSTVPCKVEGQGSAAEIELKLLFANATARVLTDYEKTMQAARIKELLLEMKADGFKFKGRMRDIVADILKVSPAQMGRMESIEKHLSTEFKEEFKVGNIGITDAYTLSTQEPHEQNIALERYRETRELDAPKRDKWQKAFVSLTDKDGGIVKYSGNLTLIVAVDTETDLFSGAFSVADGVSGLDYATLAKAVCVECLSRIEGDETSVDILRTNLAGLFTNGFEMQVRKTGGSTNGTK